MSHFISKKCFNFMEMLKTNSRKIRSISSDKPTYIYDASLNELEDIDLKILAKQVIDTLRLQFEKYNASIDFKVSGNDFSLRADRTHLTNVVYNLLDNALKYSNKNPNITVEITENEKNIKLTIADDGIGIEPVYQGKVFEKFFRVPTGDTHDVKGYGLGLSYVASVVQQHGGEVKLDSVLEKGSRFMITLPKTA